jgi:CelD/BcsL family acetyltransferase involved in cellulose biosynthesis
MIFNHSGLTIEELDRAAAPVALAGDLEDLANRALEPNVFSESLIFLPALDLIDVHVPLKIVCVRDSSGSLLCTLPLVLEPLRKGLPVAILRNWTHRYCFLGTPLIDAAQAPQVLTAIASWVESGAAPAGGLEWVNVSWDGPFARLIRSVFGSSGGWTVNATTSKRATLERDAPSRQPISGRHAKELRRLERRLADTGTLTYSAMQPGEDWRPWLETFLAVEASGWKGAEGSAINSKPADRDFFHRVLLRAAQHRQLQMLKLQVADQVVAVKLNVRAHGRSYSLKIGHDERFSQFSPGVLLEQFNIRKFADEPGDILSMDSCAAADHPMINRLWSTRREIATVTMARRGPVLRAAVAIQPVLRQLRSLLR